MPISAPNTVALDVMRSPALPDIAAARAEIDRRHGLLDARTEGETLARVLDFRRVKGHRLYPFVN